MSRNLQNIKRHSSVVLLHEGAIGDTIVMMPLLPWIRKKFPDSRIIMLNLGNGRAVEELLKNTGYIDEFLALDGSRSRVQRFSKLVSLMWLLRKRKCTDLIWLIRTFEENEKTIRAQKCRHRLFFKMAGVRRFWAMSDRHEILEGKMRHVLSLLAESLRNTGIYLPPDEELAWDYEFTEQEKGRASEVVARLGISPKKILAVGCGGKQAVCLWGNDSWKTLLRKISEELGLFLLFLGGSAEAQKIMELRSVLPEDCSASLEAEHLSLRETALVLKECVGYVGHDTGVLHLAASMRLPCVGIYSAHNRQKLWEPWSDGSVIHRHELPCACCQKSVCPQGTPSPCINAILPEDVFNSLESIFGEKKGK